MGNMILCCGLSGSGKTTFCKKFVEEHKDYIHLNVDDFYQVYNGAQVHKNEYEVWIMFFNAIHTAAVQGKNVIVDTNALDYIDRAQFVRWFREFDSHSLYWVCADFRIAYNNNLNRDRVIPEKVWLKMYDDTKEPNLEMDNEWDNITIIYNSNKETYETEVIK